MYNRSDFIYKCPINIYRCRDIGKIIQFFNFQRLVLGFGFSFDMLKQYSQGISFVLSRYSQDLSFVLSQKWYCSENIIYFFLRSIWLLILAPAPSKNFQNTLLHCQPPVLHRWWYHCPVKYYCYLHPKMRLKHNKYWL